MNLKGEVVGISTPFPGHLRQALGMMNHVMPATRARRIAADLLDFGQVRRGFLGVQIEPARVMPGRPFGGPEPVIISDVTPGTAAAAAGLRPGDRIVSANGRQLFRLGQLQSLVEETPIGEEITLLIDRGGQRLEVKVRPQAQAVPAEQPGMPRTRIEGEIRPETPGEQPRSRVVPANPPARPANPPARPANPPKDSEPSSLDPIPADDLVPARPSAVPPDPRPE